VHGRVNYRHVRVACIFASRQIRWVHAYMFTLVKRYLTVFSWYRYGLDGDGICKQTQRIVCAWVHLTICKLLPSGNVVKLATSTAAVDLSWLLDIQSCAVVECSTQPLLL